MRHAWVPAVLGLAGCKIENTFLAQRQTDVFHQVENDEIDILFVVDNSFSMTEEQQALANGFVSFMTELENANSNFHIGVISTSQDSDDPDRGKLIGTPPFLTAEDDYLREFATRVRVGIDGSDKEKGLQAAGYALSPEMLVQYNVGFLRPLAKLLVIIVSDEDDCSDDGALDGMDAVSCYQQRDYLVPVRELVNRIHDSKNNAELVQIAGIVGPYDDSCADAYTGWRYVDAVRYTGGLLGKICETDWSDMLYELGLNAIGVLSVFKLSHAADVATIEVYVDDVSVPASDTNGWTYDWQYWTLEFHGSAIPPRGSEIRVEYEIAPYAEPALE